MRIPGTERLTPSRDRPRSRLLAGLVVAVALATAAVTVVPVPDDALAAGMVADASSSVSPVPSSSESASPAPSPSESPSPVPSPSGSPSDPPSPVPTPSPSVAPTPSPSPSLSPGVVPTPSPTPPWPTTIATVDTSVRFFGRGNGHGVGLSQYGARGRALAGQTANQILKAYFTGSGLATTSPTRAVRVLLMTGYPALSSAPLTVYGRGGAWTVSGTTLVFPADAALKAWRTTTTVAGVMTTTWRLQVMAGDGTTVLYAAVVTGVITMRPVDATTTLQLWSKPSTYDTYRGALQLRLGVNSLNVINRIGLDDYLRGVVPVEMPSSWPVEALSAQAIAARSYAVRRLHPATGTFDLYDDSRSLVYRGQEAEKPETDAIIAAAPGAIMLASGKVVDAYFHSTGGGATESSRYAFVRSNGRPAATNIRYLRGIDDRAPDGTAWDAAAPYFAWTTTTITRAELSAILRADPRTNVGDILRLDLTHRGVSGRLYQVILYGSTGAKTLSADIFRAVYNAHRPPGTAAIMSNLFDARPLP